MLQFLLNSSQNLFYDLSKLTTPQVCPNARPIHWPLFALGRKQIHKEANVLVYPNSRRKASHNAIIFWHFRLSVNFLTTHNIVYGPSPCLWQIDLRGLCVVFKHNLGLWDILQMFFSTKIFFVHLV